MAFSSNVLSIERSGPVGTLWLDRAEKRNAMSAEMWTALPAAMAELASDSDVRAVVLAARGKSFCVGLDLAAFGSGGAVNGSGGGGGVSQATANLKQIEVTRGFQAASRRRSARWRPAPCRSSPRSTAIASAAGST